MVCDISNRIFRKIIGVRIVNPSPGDNCDIVGHPVRLSKQGYHLVESSVISGVCVSDHVATEIQIPNKVSSGA